MQDYMTNCANIAAIYAEWQLTGKDLLFMDLQVEAVRIAEAELNTMQLNADQHQAGITAALEALEDYDIDHAGLCAHIATNARLGAYMAPVEQEDEEVCLNYDQQESGLPGPEDEAYLQQLHEAVHRMSAEDSWLMHAYFGLAPATQQSIDEIAAFKGVSRAAAYRDVNRVLANLAKEITP